MKTGILTILIIIYLALVPFVLAQTGNGYDLTWWTVDSGGGISSNNGYELDGTVGQPDAGFASSGTGYTLAGGFLSDNNPPNLYLPIILRNK